MPAFPVGDASGLTGIMGGCSPGANGDGNQTFFHRSTALIRIRSVMPHTPKAAIVATMLAVSLLTGDESAPVATADSPKRKATTNVDHEGVLRTVRSKSFLMTTDLSEEEARELLVRLETMLRLVSAYWGRPHRGVIPMYVAKDFARWPAEQIVQMDRAGVQSIRRGGGLTVSETVVSGNAFRSKATVYAVADRGTPQHEAVHAYCTHAFGTCGPVWYAEGMAEVGNYWQEQDDKSVRAPLQVIRFLKRSDPKPLQAIVDSRLQTSGDSWQNYASRWALCHLLGHNPNYTRRFKPLGLQLLNPAAKNASFWQVYGTQAEEIDFEYRLFLQNLAPGYRVDLCSWDWKTKFRSPRGGRPVVSKIAANRGWQASRLRVVANATYEVETEGSWRLTKGGAAIDANGSEDGTGKLVGVVFADRQLGTPFSLAAAGTFTAPAAGDLFLRCQDGWGQLADNSGTITVRIKTADRPPSRSTRRQARPATPRKDSALPELAPDPDPTQDR